MVLSKQGNPNVTVSLSVKHVVVLLKQLVDQINSKYFNIVVVTLQ